MTFDEHHRDLRSTRPGDWTGPSNVVLVERLDSTNRLGRRIIDEYLQESMVPPRALLLAHEQTGGRGRHGRRWSSPPGRGVYATLLLEVAGAGALATLPLLVAVGLARALGRWLPEAGCRIKWPNDLMVRGKKIGGVLIEAVSRGAARRFAIVGFGINRGQSCEELPAGPATSLRLECAAPPSLGEVTWGLVASVEAELEHLGALPYAVECYRELSVHRPGDALACRMGEEIVEGVFAGFDDRGFLILASGGGERRIAAGEVIE